MFDKLGKRRYALPFLGVIVICCVMSLALYPMLNAQPNNVPMAIVSLDKGVITPAGSVNAGDKMVEKMTDTSGSDEDAVIKWSQLKTRQAADRALKNNDYYGAVIIPDDFTSKQMAAQTGQADAPTLKIIINQGKNTMLSTTLQTALTSMTDKMGIASEVETIHSVTSKGGALSSIMGAQMTVMPLFMMSMIAAVLIYLAIRRNEEDYYGGRSRTLGIQLIYAVAASFLISWGTILAVGVLGNIDMPTGTVMLFLWLASFAVIMLIFGCFNIIFPLGVTVLLLMFACGMSSAMIAPEMLPDFWASWIYPWVPQHYIGDGIREILYMDGGAWNAGSPALMIMAAIGLLLAITGTYIPRKNPSTSNLETE